MEITCEPKNIMLMNKGSKLANASITLDNAFVVRNLSVMNGANGLFVSMPSQKGLDKEGKEKYYDTAFPLSKELRSEINNVVLDAYAEKLKELQAFAANRDNSAANNDDEQAEADDDCYPY